MKPLSLLPRPSLSRCAVAARLAGRHRCAPVHAGALLPRTRCAFYRAHPPLLLCSQSFATSSSSAAAAPVSASPSSSPAATAAITATAADAPGNTSSSRVQADSGQTERVKVDAFSPAKPPTNVVLTSIQGETSSEAAKPGAGQPETSYLMPHPHWQDEYVRRIYYTHRIPTSQVDWLALKTIRAMRFNFDWMSGYSFGRLTEKKALTRIVFLETVAGVPGSIGGILRHLTSLRRMRRDGGWINTLFEEAENERMHLLTALQLRKPGRFMRLSVFLTQGVFFNFFWVAYLISPHFCHRLVGYLEEEAVVTYTKILHEIDKEDGTLRAWRTLPAPSVARAYWDLPENATFRDVLMHIRADEAHHRDVNHTLASLRPTELNPFRTLPKANP